MNTLTRLARYRYFREKGFDHETARQYAGIPPRHKRTQRDPAEPPADKPTPPPDLFTAGTAARDLSPGRLAALYIAAAFVFAAFVFLLIGIFARP